MLGFVGASATAHPNIAPRPAASCGGQSQAFHVHRAKALLGKAYPVTYYSTHAVASRDDIETFQAQKHCVISERTRKQLASRRHDLARTQKSRIEWTPFLGGNGYYYAIPWRSVECESGGSYTIGYAGAYGMTAPAWGEVNGPSRTGSATAGGAMPWQQDMLAHELYLRHGDGAWVPYEGGCSV